MATAIFLESAPASSGISPGSRLNAERRLAFSVLLQTATVLAPPTSLPDGYEFLTYPWEINEAEASGLLRNVLGSNVPIDYTVSGRDIEAHMDGFETLDIGVLHKATERLVGFGTLQYEGPVGYLSDLAVISDHRHRGIGKALVRERVRIADGAGLEQLNVQLLASNSLAAYYEKIGFEYEYKGSDRLFRCQGAKLPT